MKEYLGDGVYAIHDDYGGIWLHANDLDLPSDKIYLEPKVYEALLKFRERWIEKREAELGKKKTG